MKFSVFQVSRKGGRELNEDRMGYCYTRDSGLFLLADGMGGHPEGEVAAQIALQAISAHYQKRASPMVTDVPEFLSSAVMAAHHQIVRHASEKGMLDTPRTTVVGVVLQKGAAHWIHCGDSRLYVVRDGALLTRTRDHSYQERHEVAHAHLESVNRNILFTCLGSPTRPVYDVSGPLILQQGDKIMLCSDGLWDQISDEEITGQLAALPVAEAVPELVERALRHGGARSDNVTAIAVEWETPEQQDPHDVASAGILSEAGFASTIQAGMVDAYLDNFDDEAIERSIAEINEAIRRGADRRSAARKQK